MRANIQLFNEDCLPAMRGMKDKQFDLAIVDPPYGIGMSGGLLGNSKINYKNFSGNDENIPNKLYFDELFRISQNQIIWGGNYMIKHLFPTSCFIVWDKVQPEKFSMAMCELAWSSFNSPAKIFKKRIVGADKDGRIHPTQKPVALYKWLLKNYAKPGDKILDTHLGSGSIAIACWDMGFDLTGYEIDKDYYDAAVNRLENHKRQMQLF